MLDPTHGYFATSLPKLTEVGVEVEEEEEEVVVVGGATTMNITTTATTKTIPVAGY